MIWRDKLGWPVEMVKGRRILNFVRLLIHTNLRRTWLGTRCPGCGKKGEFRDKHTTQMWCGNCDRPANPTAQGVYQKCDNSGI